MHETNQGKLKICALRFRLVRVRIFVCIKILTLHSFSKVDIIEKQVII